MHTSIPLLFGSCNKYFLSNILCSPRPENTQEQKFNPETMLLQGRLLADFTPQPKPLLTQLGLLVLKCQVPNPGPHVKARTQSQPHLHPGFPLFKFKLAVYMFILQRMSRKYKAGSSFSQQRLDSLKAICQHPL